MIYFRFPNGSTFYTLKEDPEGTEMVQFVSFDRKEKLDFTGTLQEISREELKKNEFSTTELKSAKTHHTEGSELDYLNKLKQVIEYIKKHQLKKLVISRIKEIEYPSVSLSATFLNLCQKYPNAFVYFFVKDGCCWMGAFSEILGKYNHQTSEFQTMSLAGTLPVNENWTEKEIEEQKPVTQYIHEVLNQYSKVVNVSDTRDHHSGNIKHLRTDFDAKVAKEQLPKLISDLHPTPAVCGFPKDLCMEAISTFEAYPREFYAGYIRTENDGLTQYFVNLRCAEFTRTKAYLHVGGGITAQSIPEKEWRETELKAQAIAENIVLK